MNLKLKVDILNFRSNDRIYLTIFSIIIGILTGLGAVGVKKLIALFSYLFYGEGHLVVLLQSTPKWKIVLYPSLAGLIIGPVIFFLAKEAKGSGIPDIISSILLKSGKIRAIVAFVKVFTSSLSIAVGASLGSEGPQAQIGASISSTIGQIFIKNDEYIKILVAAGAGAGISAAFHSPMAGALFASEVILGSFSVASFSPIIMASVSATLVSEHFLGTNRIFFYIVDYTMKTPVEFLFYIILGIIAGLISLLFIWTLYFSEEFFDNKIKFIPEYLKPALGGLLIGLIGVYLPYVMGAGFDTIKLMMLGKFSMGFIALLLVFKIISTNISLGAGFSGGVFAPSLFLGAALGIFFGNFVNTYLGLNVPIEIWAVLAMAALVSGTTQAPITAMMMIFEMSKNYSLMLPLMTVSIIASLITMLIKRESIYTQKLLQKGILLRTKEENDIIKNKKIDKYVKKDIKYFLQSSKINKVIIGVIHTEQFIFPIINTEANKELVGLISMDSLKFVFEEDIPSITQELMIAKDLMDKLEFIPLGIDIITALEIFTKSNYSILPVVDKDKKLIGLLSEHKILKIYNNEYRKKEIARVILRKSEISDGNHGVEGISIGNSMYITEIKPPKETILKSLKDTNFRNIYNLEIVLIKKSNGAKIFPTGDYILQDKDRLMILGTAENIKEFRLNTDKKQT